MTTLGFINIVRRAVGLPRALAFDSEVGVRGSESRCMLALALGCQIGAASDPSVDGGVAQFVMGFPDVATARRIAQLTGCAWCEPLPCVLLPDLLADLAAAFDFGDGADLSSKCR